MTFLRAASFLVPRNFLERHHRCASGAINHVFLKESPDKSYATICLSRPPVNGLNQEFMEEITGAITDLEARKFRGFILTSACANTFSAGLDINELHNPETSRFRAMWKTFQEMWKTLYLTPLATIAAINGNAPAAGCLLAMSCDYRIMLRSQGVIGLNAIHLGIVVPKWLQVLLVSNVGLRSAEKSLQLGILYKPEQALSMDIVDELVDSPSQLQEVAESRMKKLLEVNDTARFVTKVSLRRPFVDNLCTYEDVELNEALDFFQAEETKEKLSNYMKNLKARKT